MKTRKLPLACLALAAMVSAAPGQSPFDAPPPEEQNPFFAPAAGQADAPSPFAPPLPAGQPEAPEPSPFASPPGEGPAGMDASPSEAPLSGDPANPFAGPALSPSQRDALVEQKLAELRALNTAGDWNAAVIKADEILALNPKHSITRLYRRSAAENLMKAGQPVPGGAALPPLDDAAPPPPPPPVAATPAPVPAPAQQNSPAAASASSKASGPSSVAGVPLTGANIAIAVAILTALGVGGFIALKGGGGSGEARPSKASKKKGKKGFSPLRRSESQEGPGAQQVMAALSENTKLGLGAAALESDANLFDPAKMRRATFSAEADMEAPPVEDMKTVIGDEEPEPDPEPETAPSVDLAGLDELDNGPKPKKRRAVPVSFATRKPASSAPAPASEDRHVLETLPPFSSEEEGGSEPASVPAPASKAPEAPSPTASGSNFNFNALMGEGKAPSSSASKEAAKSAAGNFFSAKDSGFGSAPSAKSRPAPPPPAFSFGSADDNDDASAASPPPAKSDSPFKADFLQDAEMSAMLKDKPSPFGQASSPRAAGSNPFAGAESVSASPSSSGKDFQNVFSASASDDDEDEDDAAAIFSAPDATEGGLTSHSALFGGLDATASDAPPAKPRQKPAEDPGLTSHSALFGGLDATGSDAPAAKPKPKPAEDPGLTSHSALFGEADATGSDAPAAKPKPNPFAFAADSGGGSAISSPIGAAAGSLANLAKESPEPAPGQLDATLPLADMPAPPEESTLLTLKDKNPGEAGAPGGAGLDATLPLGTAPASSPESAESGQPIAPVVAEGGAGDETAFSPLTGQSGNANAARAIETSTRDAAADSGPEDEETEKRKARGAAMVAEQTKLAEKAASSGDWRKAVHYYSIASALAPGDDSLKKALLDARAERDANASKT